MHISSFTLKALVILVVLFVVFLAYMFVYDSQKIVLTAEHKIETVNIPSNTSSTTQDSLEIAPETVDVPAPEATEMPIKKVEQKEVEAKIEELPEITENVPNKEIPIYEVPPKPVPTISFSDINLNTREALVNIFCLTKGQHQYITPISAGGIIIDERGVILTNAHIAQYLLFENFPTDDFMNCLIRTGSPAKAQYHADILYLPPKWIDDNADVFATENALGTGEDDYALLLITEPVNGVTLPDTFKAIDRDATENLVLQNDALLVAGYPAGFLGGTSVHKELYAGSSITKAFELYTFDTGSLDLISLGGTILAQQGSSGGPVVNEYGNLVGLISVSSDAESTADRDLRAITLEHIERSLVANNQTTLEELLMGDLQAKADAFNKDTAPTLLQTLIDSF